MILLWLILIPVLGGLLAALAGRWSTSWPRWISLIAFVGELFVLLVIWMGYLQAGPPPSGPWLAGLDRAWIPQFGIRFHLGMDGLSLLLVLLSSFLGLLSVACSWAGIQYRVGFFHLNLMWTVAALIGVFLALDLFLFYFFWELMLVPLYFLIGIWGHERRIYAAIKFFIFTQASGLLMLLAILGLYFIHGRSTGVYTFDYFQLLGTSMAPATAMWLMLGFFVAFAVKLPAVPVHTWLPDAHTEAPTAGSVHLAGLVLKVGAYGFLRFLVPLFPAAAFDFTPVAMILGVIGILYGAVLAFAQTDVKRLVAYTSISHMGFVLLGIFSWNHLALQGAVMVMLAHGITTAALFILVGDLQDRMHTRDMDRMGGLWAIMPRMGGTGMLFAVATLGLPGLGNFIGEFLVLLGVYRANVAIAVLATLGFIASTVYALWMMQRVFLGSNRLGWQLPDSTPRERGIMAAMIAVIVWLGLYPQTVLTSASPALQALQQYTAEALNQSSLVPITEASPRHPEASQTSRSGSSDGDHT